MRAVFFSIQPSTLGHVDNAFRVIGVLISLRARTVVRPLRRADSTGRCNTLTTAQVQGVLQMKQRPRIYYSDTQKALMWERWKKGWTLHEIGKLFDRAHSSIHRIIAETGGFRPPERSRAVIALTLAEREEISRAMVSGDSIRSIATRLGRAPSTISREIKRNGDCDGYRANQADEAACRWLKTNTVKSFLMSVRLRYAPASSWRDSSSCLGH